MIWDFCLAYASFMPKNYFLRSTILILNLDPSITNIPRYIQIYDKNYDTEGEGVIRR
jgi:hypothetical protein